MTDETTWAGRFPRNEIISLLDVNRRYNLAESTSLDLTFGEIVDLAGGLTELGSLKLGYGSSAGLPRLRAGIANLTGIDASDVIVMQGTALGLFLLGMELCRPGDEAVIVTPCFPPSRDSLAGTGVTLRECRLSFDNGYRLTSKLLEPFLNSRTRLVSIATPQNPSGVRTPLPELAVIAETMRRLAPRAYLFIDETYRDATYGREPSPASAALLGPHVITGASVSKAYGAPGLRVGWLTVRDEGLRERLTIAKMNTVISCSPIDETLAAAVIENRDRILEPRRKLLAAGRNSVMEWVNGQNCEVEWVKPDGGALCCLRLNPVAFDAEGVRRFWAALPDAGLQLGDGAWFRESSAVFRLGFGYLPIEVLPAALATLSMVIDKAAQA